MISKLKKVMSRDGSASLPLPPEAFNPATTVVAPGNQWYSPSVFGASTLARGVSSGETASEVMSTLQRLTRDEYMDFVLEIYRRGLDRFGSHWCYADINTVLYGVGKHIPIRDYMEIGVRRGRSMAMVAVQAPQARIVGFDMWIPDYAGMKNPGPQGVKEELSRVNFEGTLEFVDGDSAKTVPQWFREHPDRWFDMITVDGDHSIEGARKDLVNVIERLKVGGVLVFDDISNPSHPGLADLWHDTISRDQRFSTWEFDDVGFGVALAVRRR